MIREYVAYVRDNPEGYWFKRKLYGFGWVPVRWQGWVAILTYLAFIFGLVLTREQDIPGNPDSGSNFLVFALPIIIATIVLIIICYKKGERPRWQWGLPKDQSKDQ